MLLNEVEIYHFFLTTPKIKIKLKLEKMKKKVSPHFNFPRLSEKPNREQKIQDNTRDMQIPTMLLS